MTKVWLFLLGVSWVFTAMAEPSVFEHPIELDKPSEQLLAVTETIGNSAILRGEFKQNKYIAVLSRPLQSEGRLLSVKGRGLLWEIVKPVQSSYVISPQGIRNLQSNSAIPMGGIAQSLGGVFSALINGDLDVLSGYFHIFFVPRAENQWVIGLVPHQNSLVAKGIKRIVLKGNTHINAITIDEVNDDTTELFFFSMQSQSEINPNTLSQQETQYFVE